MAQRPVLVFAEEAAEPAHALAADDVIGVDPLDQIGHVGDVPADDDRGVRLILPDQLAHLLHLRRVRNDRRDADDVVLPRAKLFDEAVERGEVQQRAGGFDVRLNHHQAPTAMEHPQRERALRARHLIMVELHRVHSPAAVFVVLAVGPEDARQQNSCVRSGRMRGVRLRMGGCDLDRAWRSQVRDSEFAFAFSVTVGIIRVVALCPTAAVYPLCNRCVIVLQLSARRTNRETASPVRGAGVFTRSW